MSKIKIQGNASGTGVLTVTTPNTSTDRTITLPDETATLSTFNPDAAVTINESGADVDFRVESDTNTHALFVQGSDGNVGIGTTAPILGKVHLLAAGTSDASLENVAHFGKNSTSRAGLQIRANATQVDVGLQAQAGAGNLDLSFSTLVGGGHYERMRLLSAGGLTFNGDTAASNALDDYEEGTFTPTINASSVSYNNQIGRYTKIGNKVFIDIYINISSISTTSSYSIILGLPFASSATYYPALATKVSGFAWGGSATMLTFQVQPSATSIGAAGAYNNGGFNDVNANGLAAGDWIAISGSYTV